MSAKPKRSPKRSPEPKRPLRPRRLLTFNCHEAWVHQLATLGIPLDIVDGLPGRYTSRWDERMRPVPSRARFRTLDEVLPATEPFECIVGHNLSDLLDVRMLTGPRILVLHVTLEHRVQAAGMGQAPDGLRDAITQYLAMAGGRSVAVSEMKARSWGLGSLVVESGVDVAAYPPWSGHVAAGLRIANQIDARRQYLYWDFHQAAFANLPVRILGHNPTMPGVEPATSWDELKRELSAHRFFIHTADPVLEDGFNMALMEALAAGLPVLGNRHPTSPVEHGVSGFLSDDPVELAGFARRLLADRELAGRMGEAARELARRRFGLDRFVTGFGRAIERAQARWRQRARAVPH